MMRDDFDFDFISVLKSQMKDWTDAQFLEAMSYLPVMTQEQTAALWQLMELKSIELPIVADRPIGLGYRQARLIAEAAIRYFHVLTDDTLTGSVDDATGELGKAIMRANCALCMWGTGLHHHPGCPDYDTEGV